MRFSVFYEKDSMSAGREEDRVRQRFWLWPSGLKQEKGQKTHHDVIIFMLQKSGLAPANQTKKKLVHELFAGAFRNKSSM